MTDKELREIRRRFRPDRSNIVNIKGCIVNVENEIIAKINQPLIDCTNGEAEKLLKTMKKALSGALGTNLIGLDYATRQATEDEHHKALMALRDSGLRDEGLLNNYFERVKESVNIEGNYAILIAYDKYDVFGYTKDGDKEESSTTFSYIISCICPVKPLAGGLYFKDDEQSFRSLQSHAMLMNPELGFMFPSFDDRAANIYSTLYYTRDLSNLHPQFIENIIGTEIPMSATNKKESFNTILTDVLCDECDLEVVKSVHGQISEMVEEHKREKNPEPLTLSKEALQTVLKYCGIDEKKVDNFGERFDTEFGNNAEVAPKAIVDTKKFEVQTPDISIKVNPERSDLVSTQEINGVKYIMIRANEGVEVNGVKIEI